MLNFPSAWRFGPPAGYDPIPADVVSDIFDLIRRTATQDPEYQRTLERFKTFFARAGDAVDGWSSSASWAETDLLSLMQDATANAPLFIKAFYDGWEASRNEDLDVPDTDVMNGVLAKHGVPFRIEPPDLRPVGADNAVVVIPVPEAPPTLAEQAVVVLQRSLERSEELWARGHDREAVKKSCSFSSRSPRRSVAWTRKQVRLEARTSTRLCANSAKRAHGQLSSKYSSGSPPCTGTCRHLLVAASDMGSTSTEASRLTTVRHASTAT